MGFTRKDIPRGFRIPFGPWIIPPIGAALCLLLMATSSKKTGVRLAVWVGIGQIIYFTYGYWHSKLRYPKETNTAPPVLRDVNESFDADCVTNGSGLVENVNKIEES